MAWILMQPADDPTCVSAMDKLKKEGICLFDLSIAGPRLKPLAFGSRNCSTAERHFHSFVGEAACGRWAISQNRKYLWGQHFFWLCDCLAVKEIIDYSGPIDMILRWSQELLGYNFTIVHRPSQMMVDVDALTRRYDSAIAQH